jgi:hypothetical protein
MIMIGKANPSMENANPTNRNIARYIFVALAAFNGLIALGLGVWMLADTPGALKAFNITYVPELSVVGRGIGGLLGLMAALSFVSIVWLRRGKIEGVLVPAAYAIYLLTVSLMDFSSTGSLNILLVDGSRGFLTVVAAVFAYREMMS